MSTDNVTVEDVPEKIDVLFKATGDAPILKSPKWSIRSEVTLAQLLVKLKTLLRMTPEESLFMYVNQAFAPALDETLETLFRVYATNGKLAIHYAKTEAWG